MNYHICTNAKQLALHDSYFEKMEFKNGNLTLHNIQYGHVFTTPELGISIGKGDLTFQKVYSFQVDSLEDLDFDTAFQDAEISMYHFEEETVSEKLRKYTIHFGREFYNDLTVVAASFEFKYIPGDESENFVSANYR